MRHKHFPHLFSINLQNKEYFKVKNRICVALIALLVSGFMNQMSASHQIIIHNAALSLNPKSVNSEKLDSGDEGDPFAVSTSKNYKEFLCKWPNCYG